MRAALAGAGLIAGRREGRNLFYSPNLIRAELAEVHAPLRRAGRPVLEEGATACCYARSEKSWVDDPQGVRWETFFTTRQGTVFGHDPVGAGETESAASSCCARSC